MKASSLFPDDEVPIQPVTERSEPSLWVRRLVVVAGRSPGASIIREVTFRPGLNVVRVAEHPTGQGEPVGHSVGKTLLTRLIRYCLGERYFADAAVLGRIAKALPGAYVIAEIATAGQGWIVARPLADRLLSDSFSLPSDDWRSGLIETGDLHSYTVFFEAISQAMLASLPPLELPEAGHPARWLDLLAWLARDQECSYRHYNEWRDPDANSGTARLHRDDASLLMRWAMDLLDVEEITLISGHTTLLHDHSEARRDHDRLSVSLVAQRDRLRTRLGLSDDDVHEEFFLQRAKRAAREQIESLERLQAEFEENDSVLRHHEEVVRIAQEQGAVGSELDRLRGLRQQAEGERKLIRESSLSEYYAGFDPEPGCPLNRDDCSRHRDAASSDVSDPQRESRLMKQDELVARYDSLISQDEERLVQLQELRNQAQRRYVEESRSQRTKVSGTQSQIDHWKRLAGEVEQYERDAQDLRRAERRADQLDRERTNSLGKQEASRSGKKRLHRELSRHFDRTLKRLLGNGSTGEIKLDARGLHPAPGPEVRANGVALSTLSSVLGLDLACLTASICGHGRMPPFLIHDSPKEADMETALYDRLFTLALELERSYQGRPHSFQYILTTTSPPLAEVADEPYTRLVLDARDHEGLLLRRSF